MDKTRDTRVIKKGDYVPDGLFFPPWGDGTYRVFKFKKVEDIIMDNIENYPEGENNDQVDARVPTPTLFAVGFNIAVAAFELVGFLLIVFLIPILVGILGLFLGPKLYEAAQTNIYWQTFLYWIVGALATAAIVVACIGIYAFSSAFIGAIKLSLKRISMRKLN